MSNEKVAYESIPTNKDADKKPDDHTGLGVRHIQVMLLFFNLSIAYSMRAQLSVSMVAMTGANLPEFQNTRCSEDSHNFAPLNASDVNTTEIENYDSINETCLESRSLSNWNVYRTYKWSKPTQEMVLYAFFAGYTSMMLPMGIVAQKYGGKLPILIALGSNAVLSVLTPWLPIFLGWKAMCVCRLLQGMTQSCFYPSIHTMLAKWAPLSERGRLSTYAYTGSQFGTVLGFQVAGLFASSPYLGWPATFWFCGGASAFCFLLFLWLGKATPHEHPKITSEELAFITRDCNGDTMPKKRKTPWLHILSSLPVWSLIVAQTGSTIGYLFILTQIPLYMNKILGVDIKNNGLYSSLPYIAMYFTTLACGYISDCIANKKILSVVNIRRLFNSIGLPVSGLFLIGFCFVNSTSVAIIMLVLCLTSHSGVFVGFHINHIDLSPNFAGPIMALCNMVANLSSLLVPVLTSFVIKDDVTNQSKWQILFLSIACIEILANLFFVIFVKGSVQSWNFYGEENDIENEEMICVMKEKEIVIVKKSTEVEQ